MKLTIDKAGRVVIPAQIRARLGLVPGTELDVHVDDFTIRLTRSVPGARLERDGNRWVVRPTAPAKARAKIDVAALIEEERDRWPI